MSRFAALMAREISELSGEARALGKSALRRAVVALVAALFAVAGVGFLLSAGHMILARSLGPEKAGLIIGATLLSCAAVLFLFLFLSALLSRRSRPSAAASPEPGAAPASAKDLAPLAAFLVGFVLSRRLRRRYGR